MPESSIIVSDKIDSHRNQTVALNRCAGSISFILVPMNIFLMVAIFLAVLFVADALVRFIYILRLRFQILRRGDYRQRVIEIGQDRPAITIAMLGDSVLYGEGSDYDLPALHIVARRLAAKKHQVIVHNYAVTSHTIAELTDKQLSKAMPADLIFIYIGGNDYFRFTPAKSFASEVDRLLNKLSGKTIIWCTLADPHYLYPLPFWLRTIFHRYAIAYTSYVKSAIQKHPNEHWYVIDFFHEAQQRITSQKLRTRSLLSDGFHASTAGHELWCSIVADEYDKLKRQGATLP